MYGLMGKLVSEQHGAFVKNRCIQEQIVLAYELINELDIKRRGGNVGLKLDITQAYDSLSWEFLFEVMKKFGFSQKCITWLHQLFTSARISVLVNGGPVGFFDVSRGLRQGDPLSPILFVIFEDVLSRKLSKMVEENEIMPMVNYRGVHPIHILFADDVFLFVNGHKRNLQKVMKLLKYYQSSSGQVINQMKIKLFVGGVTAARQQKIASELLLNISQLPDKYLGVILKPGAVKSSNFWGVVEMIQNRLASWIGKLLAFKDIITLVKSVLCSIPIYNMSVYKCPVGVVKIYERLTRNFLWTGDPYKALLMNLVWKIHNFEAEWAKFMRDKFTTITGEWISGYKKSSIWPGLKWVTEEVKQNTRWITGTSTSISVWRDAWIKEKPLMNFFEDDEYMLQNKDMRVADLIVNEEWLIPSRLLQYFQVEELPTISKQKDTRMWTGTMSGEFTVSSAVELIRKKYQKVKWAKYVWNPILHPTTASNVWKIVRGICSIDEKRQSKGFSLASKCYICCNNTDNLENILCEGYLDAGSFHYNDGTVVLKKQNLGDQGEFMYVEAKEIGIATNFIAEVMATIGAAEWALQNNKFNICINSDSKAVVSAYISGRLPWFVQQKSSAVKEIWMTAAFITLRELWFLRNKCVFENERFNEQIIKTRILKLTTESEVRMKGKMWNSAYDLQILKLFNMSCGRTVLTRIQEIYFFLPVNNQILLCCDGASKWNPGMSDMVL
ncbi:uncharacterized protein LOC113352440 [Papaver somniferum]|uniref:uncharacterized protein LOC113352440 n=1 Tax=Papaver somniferum TaxID=3469 RepID=UPI000E6F6EB9|nr:uncharacterized protein LOC113352440 [Papaver somniferum]